MTASSLNNYCIVWSCSLGHCPVVGGNWLQLSAAHRVWHGVAKWSENLPSSRSLLPCTNLPLYHHQSTPRQTHCLHHAWQMASGTRCRTRWSRASQTCSTCAMSEYSWKNWDIFSFPEWCTDPCDIGLYIITMKHEGMPVDEWHDNGPQDFIKVSLCI